MSQHRLLKCKDLRTFPGTTENASIDKTLVKSMKNFAITFSFEVFSDATLWILRSYFMDTMNPTLWIPYLLYGNASENPRRDK